MYKIYPKKLMENIGTKWQYGKTIKLSRYFYIKYKILRKLAKLIYLTSPLSNMT
jgi:hypothetical protein